ncbi:MAG: hypothetical protein ACKO7W_23985 [Elainella sp.]
MGLLIAGCLSAGSAQAQDLEAYVNSIQSVDQIKQEIRETLLQRDQCGVGSCYNFTSTSICAAVGALDIRVDGKILESGSGWSDQILPISDADLALMQQIFAQCQLSNYQYWNFDSMLHVIYSPTPAADAAIRQQLGLPPAP